MSIAETPTKLPLATWARIVGIHPLHFAQIDFTPASRSRPTTCEAPWLQYDWSQADRVSREAVAQAIAEAEEMIERHVGFRLIPSWESDEWRNAARPFRPEDFGYTANDIRGFASAVQAKWGYVQSGGIEAKTLIDDAVAIVWSDEDGDTLEETGTVTATVTEGMAPCEIEIYYPGKSGAAEYQIRPANVSVVGDTATITFRRELCVLESILKSFDPEGADYTDDDDFLDTVDVYRHYNDPSQQVQLLWSPTGICGSCGGGGCSLCAYAYQFGCLHLRGTRREAMFGWSPGTWNATTEEFDAANLAVARTPDIVRLYYQAGYVAPTGCPSVMDMNWARAVAYLSLSLLERPTCDCSANVWEYWREDLAVVSGGDQTTTYGEALRGRAANNPFGTRRGALHAWRRVIDPNVAILRSATLV